MIGSSLTITFRQQFSPYFQSNSRGTIQGHVTISLISYFHEVPRFEVTGTCPPDFLGVHVLTNVAGEVDAERYFALIKYDVPDLL